MSNSPENAFVPEVIKYVVAEKTMLLRPLPFKPLKKALLVVVDGFKDLENFKDKTNREIMEILPEVLSKKFSELASLLFPGKEHEFLTPEWIEDNVPFTLVLQVVKDAIRINGVTDFLAAMGGSLPSPTKKAEDPPKA